MLWEVCISCGLINKNPPYDLPEMNFYGPPIELGINQGASLASGASLSVLTSV